jgi:hypothetical protein
MKQTAIQHAIESLRIKIEAISLYDNLMGKHTIHHLQQVERLLYELIEAEKEQIEKAYYDGKWNDKFKTGLEYYKETYE